MSMDDARDGKSIRFWNNGTIFDLLSGRVPAEGRELYLDVTSWYVLWAIIILSGV